MATIINNVRWADNTAELKANLLQGIGTIDAMKASVDRTVASMGGSGLFGAANKLTAAIDQLGGITKLTTAEQDRANATLDKAIEKYKTMGLTAPPAMVALKKSLDDVSTSTQGSSDWLSKLGDSLALRIAEGVALRDVFNSLIGFAKDAFEEAAHIANVALATGMSTDAVQRFNYVGQEFGLTTDEMARGVEQLSAKLATGDGNAVKAVQTLGLNVNDLIAAGPKDAFLDIADAVGRIEDPTLKMGVATEVWGGKLAKILLPALGDLRSKIDDVPDLALISDENIQQAKKFDDTITHIVDMLKAAAVGAVMGPTLSQADKLNIADAAAGGPMMGLTMSDPSKAKDIDLASGAMGAAILDSATLIQNRLTALRTEALDPLTASQKANILELQKMGESEKDIAQLVGSNVVAVKLFIEATKTATEAAKTHAAEVKKQAEAMANLAIETGAYAGVLNTMDGAVVEAIRWELDHGAKVDDVAKSYLVAKASVEAIQNQLKFEQAVIRDTTKDWGDHVVVLKENSDAYAEANSRVHPLDATFTQLYVTTLPNVHSSLEKTESSFKELGDGIDSVLEKLPDIFARTFDSGGSIASALKASGRQLGQMFATALTDEIKDQLNPQKAGFTGSAVSGGTLTAAGGIGALSGVGAASGGGSVGSQLGQVGLAGAGIAAGAIGAAAASTAGITAGAIGGAVALGAATMGIGAAVIGVIALWKALSGVSEAEKQGRQTEAQFEQSFGGFNQMALAISQAYAATGRTAAQANTDVLGLMASEKQGADATQAAINKINQAFDEQTQDAADLQTAIQKYGFTIQELGPEMQKQQLDQQAQTLLNDWRLLVGSGIDVATVNTRMASSVQAYLTLAQQTGQEVPDAMEPILQKMIDQGVLTDANGNKITDLKDLGVSFSETMTEGLNKIVDKLDQLLQKIGMVPAAINQIPTDITVTTHFKGDVTDLGLPVVPMADGGSGRAMGPTLFYSKGNEDYAFSGEGSSFGSGGGSGGDVVSNITVNLDGKAIYRGQQRHQQRDLLTRRKLAAA